MSVGSNAEVPMAFCSFAADNDKRPFMTDDAHDMSFDNK